MVTTHETCKSDAYNLSSGVIAAQWLQATCAALSTLPRMLLQEVVWWNVWLLGIRIEDLNELYLFILFQRFCLMLTLVCLIQKSWSCHQVMSLILEIYLVGKNSETAESYCENMLIRQNISGLRAYPFGFLEPGNGTLPHIQSCVFFQGTCMPHFDMYLKSLMIIYLQLQLLILQASCS